MDVADPIPPSVLALLDLFATELKDVSFPGVDKAILEQVITEVRTHTEAVAKAEAALESARAALRESEETLSTKSTKALAYARVFAEDRPEVLPKVESVARIAGTSSAPPAPARERDRDRDRDASADPPKRRGRPSRNKPAADASSADTSSADTSSSDVSEGTPTAPPVMELGPAPMPAEPEDLNGAAVEAAS